MFKKITLLSFLCLFCFSFSAQAQEDEEIKAGLTPSSPFYFLDSLFEEISLFFTFDHQAKAEKAFEYAQEKIAELEAISNEEKEEVLDKAGEKYDQYLALAQEKIGQVKDEGVNTDELSQRMAQSMLRHQERLAEVYEQVPEQAKGAIDNVLQRSQQRYNKMVEGIDSEQIREQIQERVKQLQGQAGQGLTEDQKQQIEQIQNQVQQFAQNGISEQEWKQMKENLVEMIGFLEQIVKNGISQEDKEKVFQALDHFGEAILNNNQLTDQQKQDALNLIAQIESLIEAGLTPAQQVAIISALEELKTIVRNLEPGQTRDQIQEGESGSSLNQVKQKLQQGLNQEQQDSLEQAQQKVQERINNSQKFGN